MTKEILKMIKTTVEEIQEEEDMIRQEIENEAIASERDVWEDVLEIFKENPKIETINIDFYSYLDIPESTDKECEIYNGVEERLSKLLEEAGFKYIDNKYTIKTSIIRELGKKESNTTVKTKKKQPQQLN